MKHGWTQYHSYHIDQNRNGEPLSEEEREAKTSYPIDIWSQPWSDYLKAKVFHTVHAWAEDYIPLFHRLEDKIIWPPFKKRMVQMYDRNGNPTGGKIDGRMPLCAHLDCVCYELASRNRVTHLSFRDEKPIEKIPQLKDMGEMW